AFCGISANTPKMYRPKLRLLLPGIGDLPVVITADKCSEIKYCALTNGGRTSSRSRRVHLRGDSL
ncbi:hypothetical protein AVEN_15562-2-1, partial [Araneus ventricosus]